MKRAGRDARVGRIIGSSRFNGQDEARNEMEIGWTFLVRSHWAVAPITRCAATFAHAS